MRFLSAGRGPAIYAARVPLLPAPPRVTLTRTDALPTDAPFVSLSQHRLHVTVAGRQAGACVYTCIERRALDAAVICAYYTHQGARFVYLRSCVRPPLALRTAGAPEHAVLWELPAGLVEAGESPVAAAARELAEELGFAVPEAALFALGPAVAPAPALIGERQFMFRVEVSPADRLPPRGDGSPLEAGGVVIAVALELALAACAAGEVADAKTELGLRRLAEVP